VARWEILAARHELFAGFAHVSEGAVPFGLASRPHPVHESLSARGAALLCLGTRQRGSLMHVSEPGGDHKRDRSSAFLAANSSGESMPFCCKSASRSILAKMSISKAVSAL